jgi:hypothetical protein
MELGRSPAARAGQYLNGTTSDVGERGRMIKSNGGNAPHVGRRGKVRIGPSVIEVAAPKRQLCAHVGRRDKVRFGSEADIQLKVAVAPYPDIGSLASVTIRRISNFPSRNSNGELARGRLAIESFWP